MPRQTVHVACAIGDEKLAELLAHPLDEAGYAVSHHGRITVGESRYGEMQKALESGSPIVICATLKAVGSAWAHHIVNAARSTEPMRVFIVQMEKQAFVDQLALDGKVARYCDDPAQALKDLLDALVKHFPPQVDTTAPPANDTPAARRQFLDELTAAATLDVEALQHFRGQLRDEVAARYPTVLTAWEFLDRAGLRERGYLTGTGALLFARDPVTACPTALVKCTSYYGHDRASKRDIVEFDGTVPAQIVEARQFVADRVRSGEAPSADQAQSELAYEYPMVAVREIIANALVHRDYSADGACVHVRIFVDRLEVTSPGIWLGQNLAAGTEYKLADLVGQSIKRNFRLAHILSWIRLVEGEGSGIPSALRACVADQIPSPTVRQEQGFVTVTLHRPIRSGTRGRGWPVGSEVHSTIVAVDVEAFGHRRRTNLDQMSVRTGMYDVLRTAFTSAGIEWEDCYHEDRGDGVLILVPPEFPKGTLAETVPQKLADELRMYNLKHGIEKQIRLRMAMHAGEIIRDSYGIAGSSLILAVRLLEASALAAALAQSEGHLALITSSWFYEEVVRHRPGLASGFRQVSVEVKETTTNGWVYVAN